LTSDIQLKLSGPSFYWCSARKVRKLDPTVFKYRLKCPEDLHVRTCICCS